MYFMRISRYDERVTSTCRVVASSLFAVAVGLASSNAQAVERQHHLGLDPSLAMLKVADKSSLSTGPSIGVHYTYGLSDQFNFMAEGGVSFVALGGEEKTDKTPTNRPTHVEHAMVGIGYVLDVIRWVPYIGLLAGGYRLGGGTMDSSAIAFGVELAAGLDYQLTRHWAVGVTFRQHEILTRISDYPSYTTFGLRAEYAWGF